MTEARDKETDEAMARIMRCVEGMDGDQLIELGVGLAGAGAMRVQELCGPEAAADAIAPASSVLNGIHIDMLKAANRRAGERKGGAA